MKTLVVCRPRTRSNFFLAAYSSFHNISDKHEDYTRIGGRAATNTFKNQDFKFSLFQQEIKKYTERNFKQDNFAIKLFPRMLFLMEFDFDLFRLWYRKSMRLLGDSENKDTVPIARAIANSRNQPRLNSEDQHIPMINNLSYFFNIKKYDHVYFLDRDIVNAVCSYMYGIHIKSFSFTDHETAKKVLDNHATMTIDIDDPELNFYIYETVVSHKMKEFLIDQKIAHTSLDYDEIPSYFMKKNYSMAKEKTIDNKLDYSKIVTNYSEIREQIMMKYQTIKLQRDDFKFF